MSDTLTDEQVDAWRRALSFTYGVAAYTFTREHIQGIRDKIQEEIDATTNVQEERENKA